MYKNTTESPAIVESMQEPCKPKGGELLRSFIHSGFLRTALQGCHSALSPTYLLLTSIRLPGASHQLDKPERYLGHETQQVIKIEQTLNSAGLHHLSPCH